MWCLYFVCIVDYCVGDGVVVVGIVVLMWCVCGGVCVYVCFEWCVCDCWCVGCNVVFYVVVVVGVKFWFVDLVVVFYYWCGWFFDCDYYLYLLCNVGLVGFCCGVLEYLWVVGLFFVEWWLFFIGCDGESVYYCGFVGVDWFGCLEGVEFVDGIGFGGWVWFF